MAELRAGRKAGLMNTTGTTTEPGSAALKPESGLQARRLPLYRPSSDRMLAGVASGIARYLRVEVMLVRIALVTLVFVGGIGLPLYAACWLLIPAEGASQSIAGDFVSSLQAWRT
jgi:phage shock protein PspC (stress-responsive transcriptional regulator)